jgi:hypothetical protein
MIVSQWLRFDRLLTAERTKQVSLVHARDGGGLTEARTFVSDLVWNDRDFMTLFTADYGYVSSELAGIYKVPIPPKEFDRVPFPAGSQRAGLLGQGLFLALTSKPEDSSPTARGLFVREQFLCQHVPDPPPGVNTNLPPVSAEKPMTVRERLGEHATIRVAPPAINSSIHRIRPRSSMPWAPARKVCAPVRRPRPRKVAPVAGRPKTMGWRSIPLATSPAFRIPSSLRPRNSARCLPGARNAGVRGETILPVHAGRLETPADRPLLRKALDDFRGSQFRFKELIVSLLRLREFPNPEGAAHVASDHKPR